MISFLPSRLVFIVVCFVPIDCYAYLDPNAGGWLFQLLFPILVFIGGVWVAFWQRISAFLRRLFNRSDKSK